MGNLNKTCLLFVLMTAQQHNIHLPPYLNCNVLSYRLFEVRGKLYELLTNCIPPEIILKVRSFFQVLHLPLCKVLQNFMFE